MKCDGPLSSIVNHSYNDQLHTTPPLKILSFVFWIKDKLQQYNQRHQHDI